MSSTNGTSISHVKGRQKRYKPVIPAQGGFTSPRGGVNLRVKVYWNTRKGMWSIKHGGRVIAYATDLKMRDCRFLVSQSGRRKEIATCKRTIHAYVEGYVTPMTVMQVSKWEAVYYHPFSNEGFIRATDRGKALSSQEVLCGARQVILTQDKILTKGAE